MLDLYAADIARATGCLKTGPQASWDSVRVFVPRSQRIRVKRSSEFERVNRLGANRLSANDLNRHAHELVMTFRTSMRRELDDAGCLADAQAVWSMWDGYLERPASRPLLEWLSDRAIPLTRIHASGHASPIDIRRYAAAVNAKQVVPMHTSHPERFAPLIDKVQLRQDGEWWEA